MGIIIILQTQLLRSRSCVYLFGDNMMAFLADCNRYLWGFLLIVILTLGIRLTYKSRCIQLRMLPSAIHTFIDGFCKEAGEFDVSPFRATCTALAATVGTGNLAGVAGAIAIGGPGAIFWMWVSGILGMVIKFAEVIIAMRYRQRNQLGEWIGGPMINIQRGMPMKYRCLAALYAFFGVIAAFGIGNAAQIDTIVNSLGSLGSYFGYQQTIWDQLIIGLILAVFVYRTLRTGVTGIGKYAEVLVPVTAASYMILVLIALITHYNHIQYALKCIFWGAFRPAAVTGGFLGSLSQTMRVGVSRGIFTNEAGMGTASIAHASADSEDPVKQGLLGMVEVFLDTIVICTCTALIILCSRVEITYGIDCGITLTIQAFSLIFGGWIMIPLTIIIVTLAAATILGWGLYGTRCAQFLFGEAVWKYFMLLHAVIVILAATSKTSVIWLLSEIANGLMSIPNLISLTYLMTSFYDVIKPYRPK